VKIPLKNQPSRPHFCSSKNIFAQTSPLTLKLKMLAQAKSSFSLKLEIFA